MVKRIFVLTLFFYFLALMQTSFFLGTFLDFNLILLFAIFINLFEKREENFGLLSSITGGFFLDVFSSSPIGFHVLILIGLSLFIKIILRRYLRLPVLVKYENKTQ